MTTTMFGCLRAGLLVALALLSPCPGWSVTSTGAIVLNYPVGTRATAMGETGVADNSDPSNMHFNPANVVGRAGIQVQGSRRDFTFNDLWLGGGCVAVSHQRDAGSRITILSAGISYGRLDYGTSLLTEPDGTPLGEFHSFEDYISLALGAGFDFRDRWSLRAGVAGKRWAAEFAPEEFTQVGVAAEVDAIAFDAGVTVARVATVSDWAITPALAIALVNAGADIEFGDLGTDPLPTRIHFGTSVRIESPATSILSAEVPTVAVVYNVEATERLHGEAFSWGIGGELAFAEMLFVRAGVTDLGEDDDGDVHPLDISGWGIGVGLPAGSFRARVDYTKTNNLSRKNYFGFVLTWLF